MIEGAQAAWDCHRAARPFGSDNACTSDHCTSACTHDDITSEPLCYCRCSKGRSSGSDDASRLQSGALCGTFSLAWCDAHVHASLLPSVGVDGAQP